MDDDDDDSKRPMNSNAGKMKTKLNKKESNDDDNGSGANRRGRGGGAVMEGSRCSRVNGRGWRCSQQTLVGYSLCEHHLGKGRLRSITTVQTRGKEERHADRRAQILSNSLSSSSLGKQTKGETGEDGKPLMMRMKLGMVKARSISSLLGQGQ
ncbi:growth-regulating factor 7-like [Hibiscus syriacus]|nr:growth-regulating factor 7-like [Hibiscus syriacus]